MSDTTFISKVTHILATWLNDVNKAVYRAIGTGTNGVAPTTPADVRTNLGLTAAGGAALIGNDPAGGSVGANVQAALDLKLNIADSFADPTKQTNNWDDTNTPGNASQNLLYEVTSNTLTGDHRGWSAVIHENTASNTDNFVALVGASYHDGAWNGGAYWGIATEAWSNPDGYATLIGGELSIISQSPTNANPLVGINSVFKNRPDIDSHPAAPVIDGSLYNFNSSAIFISSQARPSGAGASWSNVGSGWQTVLRVGDIVAGNSGLDREGGSNYPGSGAVGEIKGYTTVVDMEGALQDMAGGFPWFALYKNASTYWGMRFNGMLTGELRTVNLLVNAGGAGYAVGDVGTINGGAGTGAHYYVRKVAGGVVTEVAVGNNGGVGYVPVAGLATTAVTGAGAGLTVDLVVATGCFYGVNLGITAAGAGYVVNEVVQVDGGTAGSCAPLLKILTIGGGGAVTSFELLTNETVATELPNSRIYANGIGFAAGVGVATTTRTGAGAGLTISIARIFDDLLIGGEKWEYWRMLNPGNPTASGERQGYIDASFPGTPPTIDTSGATYTFPVDRPF